MPDGMPERGDFGLPKKIREKDQVVAIFDLVEYTGLPRFAPRRSAPEKSAMVRSAFVRLAALRSRPL